MMHISEAMADAAWQRYEEASAQAARFLSGDQLALFDTSRAEAREWQGIAIACEREAARHA